MTNNYITEVYDNIYCIQTPLPGTPLRNINAYLIKGDSHNILIDTGYRLKRCIDVINGSLEALGAKKEETDILLTHFHNDHAGASTDVIHPESSILVPKDEFRFFGIGVDKNYYNESRRAKYTCEGLKNCEFDDMMSQNKMSAVFPNIFSKQFKPIDENDIISTGQYDLTAVHTPGHTPGHMCYYEKKHKLLFSGDHILFGITPNIIPWALIPNILGIYLNSLKKIKTLDIDHTFPGHRESGNVYLRVDEIIYHHNRRLRECISIINSRPGLTAFELTNYMSWNLRRDNLSRNVPLTLMKYAFGECLSHLDYICASNQIKREMHENAFRYYPL